MVSHRLSAGSDADKGRKSSAVQNHTVKSPRRACKPQRRFASLARSAVCSREHLLHDRQRAFDHPVNPGTVWMHTIVE